MDQSVHWLLANASVETKKGTGVDERGKATLIKEEVIHLYCNQTFKSSPKPSALEGSASSRSGPKRPHVLRTRYGKERYTRNVKCVLAASM